MSDEDRRPRYGEYASPEDQRAHIRDPKAREELAAYHRQQETARMAREAGGADAGPGDPQAAGRPAPGGGADGWGAGGPGAYGQGSGGWYAGPGGPGGAPARVRHRWDLVLTLLLLAVGLINVLTSIPGYLDFAGTLGSAYGQLGIGEAPHGAGVATAGTTLIIIESAVWLVSALVSWLSLRAKRITFWIPILGAILAYAGVVAVVLSVVLSDPAFQDFIRSAS